MINILDFKLILEMIVILKFCCYDEVIDSFGLIWVIRINIMYKED